METIKNNTQEVKCPCCRAHVDYEEILTIRITLESFFLAAVSYCLLFGYGSFLELSLEAKLIFSLIISLPFAFSWNKKRSCLICGIQYHKNA
jgi:hypothetical protein